MWPALLGQAVFRGFGRGLLFSVGPRWLWPISNIGFRSRPRSLFCRAGLPPRAGAQGSAGLLGSLGLGILLIRGARASLGLDARTGVCWHSFFTCTRALRRARALLGSASCHLCSSGSARASAKKAETLTRRGRSCARAAALAGPSGAAKRRKAALACARAHSSLLLLDHRLRTATYARHPV